MATLYLGYEGRICTTSLRYISNNDYAAHLITNQIKRDPKDIFLLTEAKIIIVAENQKPHTKSVQIAKHHPSNPQETIKTILIRDEGVKFWWDKLQPSRKLVASGNGESFNSYFSPCGDLILTTR